MEILTDWRLHRIHPEFPRYAKMVATGKFFGRRECVECKADFFAKARAYKIVCERLAPARPGKSNAAIGALTASKNGGYALI